MAPEVGLGQCQPSGIDSDTVKIGQKTPIRKSNPGISRYLGISPAYQVGVSFGVSCSGQRFPWKVPSTESTAPRRRNPDRCRRT